METVLLGLLLLAPMIWLLTVLGAVHRTALAASAAAREAGWQVASSSDARDARDGVSRAVGTALRDQRLDPELARVHASWAPGLSRGSAVEIQVSYPVSVFRAPFLGTLAQPVLWVDAIHVARIDPFRSRD